MNYLNYTLKNLQTNFWWAFDKTGKPCLFVRNSDVDSLRHLIGSLNQRSISSFVKEIFEVTSKTTPSLLEDSHKLRTFFHQCQVVDADTSHVSLPISTSLSFNSNGMLIRTL